MARDSDGIMKIGLLAVGGYAVWRWWSAREVETSETVPDTPAGITPEQQALLDSAQRTSAGGPQPGDTSSVNGPADEPPAEQTPPTLREKLLAASEGDTYFTADHKASVHRWNWYLRQVTGLSDAETPDLAGVGDPADLLSVEGYLARRTAAGLSGLGLGQFRQLRRARYPVWPARPGGGSAVRCAATGCNTYRV